MATARPGGREGCRECGAELDPQDPLCPSCGMPLAKLSFAGPPAAKAPAQLFPATTTTTTSGPSTAPPRPEKPPRGFLDAWKPVKLPQPASVAGSTEAAIASRASRRLLRPTLYAVNALLLALLVWGVAGRLQSAPSLSKQVAPRIESQLKSQLEPKGYSIGSVSCAEKDSGHLSCSVPLKSVGGSSSSLQLSVSCDSKRHCTWKPAKA